MKQQEQKHLTKEPPRAADSTGWPSPRGSSPSLHLERIEEPLEDCDTFLRLAAAVVVEKSLVEQ